jgi:hypothetical protein
MNIAMRLHAPKPEALDGLWALRFVRHVSLSQSISKYPW